MGKNTKWKNYVWAGTLAAALLVCRLALWRLPERTVAWAEDTVPKRVALTFDDGPYPNLTRQLLDGLRERGVKASFFVVGENAKAYPDVIEMMYEDGHLIGNHTYHHVQLTEVGEEKFKEEIPRYMIKHQVKPGITGWAQVNGYRGDTSIRMRIDCDLYYIENWSLGLDFKILFSTIFKGFVNKNAY